MFARDRKKTSWKFNDVLIAATDDDDDDDDDDGVGDDNSDSNGNNDNNDGGSNHYDEDKHINDDVLKKSLDQIFSRLLTFGSQLKQSSH